MQCAARTPVGLRKRSELKNGRGRGGGGGGVILLRRRSTPVPVPDALYSASSTAVHCVCYGDVCFVERVYSVTVYGCLTSSGLALTFQSKLNVRLGMNTADILSLCTLLSK
jgi:hypothetical protein